MSGDSQSAGRPSVSIVVPCYNESDNLDALLKAIDEALAGGASREIVLVDDGSADGTWEAIAAICKRRDDVRGLRLSRNFGHQAALYAGLNHAQGDAVATMDADLQHPPDLLPKMIELWKGGAEVVATIRKDDARLPLFKRLTSAAFYRIFMLLTGLPLQAGQADFRLLDRKVVDVMLGIEERSLFLRGMISWVGFRQVELQFTPGDRHAGKSKYSLRKMIRLALDGALSYSNLPLRLGIYLGFGVTFLAFCYGFYAIVIGLFLRSSMKTLVPGWASLAAIISLLFGLLFLQIGLVGEYLGRVYMETKKRPKFIVAEQAGRPRPPRDGA